MLCISVCNLLMLSSQVGCCNASCESGMVLLGILFHLVNVCCWCMLTYLCAMWCSLLRLSGVILLLCKLPMLLTVMGHLGMLHLHKAHLPSSLFFFSFFFTQMVVTGSGKRGSLFTVYPFTTTLLVHPGLTSGLSPFHLPSWAFFLSWNHSTFWFSIRSYTFCQVKYE